MADGDFSHRIDVRYHDEFSSIADSINRMADTVEAMKQKEQEAEETKNELITNVAHDLRTPLTSIIGLYRYCQQYAGSFGKTTIRIPEDYMGEGSKA